MTNRPGRGSTKPAATRRRRPAQIRRAQEAATAAAATEQEAPEVPANLASDEIQTSETDARDPGAAEVDAVEAEADADADAGQDDEEKD